MNSYRMELPAVLCVSITAENEKDARAQARALLADFEAQGDPLVEFPELDGAQYGAVFTCNSPRRIQVLDVGPA